MQLLYSCCKMRYLSLCPNISSVTTTTTTTTNAQLNELTQNTHLSTVHQKLLTPAINNLP